MSDGYRELFKALANPDPQKSARRQALAAARRELEQAKEALVEACKESYVVYRAFPLPFPAGYTKAVIEAEKKLKELGG